jgi:hypothetical protein
MAKEGTLKTKQDLQVSLDKTLEAYLDMGYEIGVNMERKRIIKMLEESETEHGRLVAEELKNDLA